MIELKVATNCDKHYVEVSEGYYKYKIEGEYTPKTKHEPAEYQDFVLEELRFPIYDSDVDKDELIINVYLCSIDIPYVGFYKDYDWYVENDMLFMGRKI